MLQAGLHVTHAGDDLQHLRVEGVKLFALLECLLLFGEVTDDRSHAGHRLTQILTGGLDLLTLQGEFTDDSLLAGLDDSQLLDADAPEVDNHEQDDDVGENHPPRKQPVAGDVDLEYTLLVTDGTLGTNGLHVQCILAAGEVAEGDTVRQSITVAPVFVLAFHPVHKLQALALVVVTGSELDGECILVVTQFEFVRLVEGLWQHDTLLVHMTSEDFLFADKQLCEHHAWQGVSVVVGLLHHPVHTVEATEQYVAVLLGDDGAWVELIALQTVGRRVVVEAVVVCAFLVVTLHDDTAHTTAGGHQMLWFLSSAIPQTLLLLSPCFSVR